MFLYRVSYTKLVPKLCEYYLNLEGSPHGFDLTDYDRIDLRCSGWDPTAPQGPWPRASTRGLEEGKKFTSHRPQVGCFSLVGEKNELSGFNGHIPFYSMCPILSNYLKQ